MTYNFETGEFSFANNPVNNRPSPFAGPELEIFGKKYQVMQYGVYEIPEPIQGCMVKTIWQNTYEMTAVVRDIATDHATTLTVGHTWMGGFIQNQIRKYRGVSDYDYLRNTLKQNWLPEWLQGDADEMEFEAMYETYRVIYSKDDTCWAYDSESSQSGLYPSTTKPSAQHYRKLEISTIGHSTDEGE
jgi:hypothetical protein